MKTIRLLKAIAGLFAILLCFASCRKDDIELPGENDQTLFIYMPWSTDLTSHFENNLADLEQALKQDILQKEKVIVFFATTATEATLFEIKYQDGKCIRNPLKSYKTATFTTAEGVTSLLNDVKHFASANRYAMVVSCHGMGWLPVSSSKTRQVGQKFHWEYEGVPQTRFFGGRSPEYQIDITTFAKGISGSGIKMEYIMFDDCYMSSIEVAYDLKDVTDYLIASPTEVMAYGFPYAEIGKYLIGKVNYYGICKGFLSFYEQYSAMPCGTIAVTDCSELPAMASVMKEINSRYAFDETKINTVQRLDGYTPIIFFDYGDYVAKLCDDKALMERFQAQLERTTPSMYRMHTESYFSASFGRVYLNTYSGITISDPSYNSLARTKGQTPWYEATH